MQASKASVVAAVQMIKAIADAIRELREVPNGVLYTQVMSVLSFNEYSTIIDRLKGTGLVAERGNVLIWVEPKAREPIDHAEVRDGRPMTNDRY